jgi:pimeloyl-ACP methyl ester carboxylesterase
MRRLALLAAVSTALSVLTAATQISTGRAAPVPIFHPMPCPSHTFQPTMHVDCGFVRVPENRARPSGRTITVAAAVIRTQSVRPRPDPIVFVDGGPSFGAISPFAVNFYFNHAGYTARRDVILVDTRGTGLSRPRLGCPELDRAAVDDFYSSPTINARTLPIFRQALAHCRDRLTGRGIDLAAYNSAESAADLEVLRQALWVHQWNLMALSADGVLGLTYLRMFPDSIRGAVIDSGQSTQMLWELDQDRGLARELNRIFAGCAADHVCRSTYPGLRRAFHRKIRQLQRKPVTITFPDFRPRPVKLTLDGVGLFADAIYSIFPGNKQAPDEIPDLLRTIWRVTHGELVQVYREAFGTGPVTNAHDNDALAVGKSMSYICHDLVDFISKADLKAAAADVPPMAPRYLGRNFDLAGGFTNFLSPAGCRSWRVGRAAAVQHQAVTSDVPTLVLAGEYDSAVPPYVVRQVTAGLSDAHYYVFPASPHLQLASFNNGSGCARTIATQFLADPHEALDASCIADLPREDFSP